MEGETVSGNGEPDTNEADALAAALNHSAERVADPVVQLPHCHALSHDRDGHDTHRMLFLAEPLNLPVLNIPLPLFAFYILTPLIFIVFHFYMLLNLVLLARTAKAFEDALVRALPEDSEARENFRMRIENTLFAQLLVGGRLERKGINAKLLSLMALITLALAPVALLLMFEVKFLPYHSEAITWLHRGLLALDLALVWTLWPAYRSGWGVPLWPMRSWRLVGPIGPGVLSTGALVYAGGRDISRRAYVFGDQLAAWNRAGQHFGPTWARFDRRRKTTHIIEKNDSSTNAPRWASTLPLAGRDLTGADLSFADVRHVEFSFAILNRASLNFAWANKAHFNRAQLRDACLDYAQLQGASLISAQVQAPRAGPGHLATPRAAPGRLARRRAAPGRLAQRRAAPGRLVLVRGSSRAPRSIEPCAAPGRFARPCAAAGRLAFSGAASGRLARPCAAPGRLA